MGKLIIQGGKKLEGRIKAAGSKNAALALIPASLLANSPVTLTNVPVISDVNVMLGIAEKLGAKITGKGTDTIGIDPTGLNGFTLDPELSAKVRASVIFAAPLLARFGKAIITPPGGDQIGERLLDTHFAMLSQMGVVIKKENGQFRLDWQKRKLNNIFLEEPSVTATEMALICASSLDTSLNIANAACEPHVADVADFLTQMGADVAGGGSNALVVKGRKEFKGVDHRVIPDCIDGGTFAIAAAVTLGEVEIEDCSQEHYRMILNYLKGLNVDIVWEKGDLLKVRPSNLKAFKKQFKTQIWPGFPTDLMSPFIVLATQTEGTVLCHDWMYEWRIFFVDDLISMGANIFIADPHRVVVTGPANLHGEKLYCKDIRAGMSIVLAALCARGESEIDNIEMVERGYEKIVERLTSLGADVKRIESGRNLL